MLHSSQRQNLYFIRIIKYYNYNISNNNINFLQDISIMDLFPIHIINISKIHIWLLLQIKIYYNVRKRSLYKIK